MVNKMISWREFNSQRMSKYMKKFGGHGPAIRQIAKEWKVFKLKQDKTLHKGKTRTQIKTQHKKIKTISNATRKKKSISMKRFFNKKSTATLEDIFNPKARTTKTKQQIKVLETQLRKLDKEDDKIDSDFNNNKKILTKSNFSFDVGVRKGRDLFTKRKKDKKMIFDKIFNLRRKIFNLKVKDNK